MKRRERLPYIDTRSGRLAALSTNYNVRFDGQYDTSGSKLLLALLQHAAEKQHRKEQDLKKNSG